MSIDVQNNIEKLYICYISNSLTIYKRIQDLNIANHLINTFNLSIQNF